MWRSWLAEDKKSKADELSSQPVSCKHGGDHVFVPFAMEDGGTLGAHAHALLKTLAAEHAVSAGRHSSPDSRSPLSPPCRCHFGCSAGRIAFPRGCMLAFHSRFSVFTRLQGSSLLVSTVACLTLWSCPCPIFTFLIGVANTLLL